ncbi:MAG: trypsin-like peptidase domain-containing protein [Chitinispirillia bacterium]|nr:trypsin-like peptidase domain-containing protein [Chitinispirillia bacterium]MCL2267581.1 trypsin-like peptidase domain-containing protein [Chitinispirillia bacterium]
MKKNRILTPAVILLTAIAMAAGFFAGGEIIHKIYTTELREFLDGDAGYHRGGISAAISSETLCGLHLKNQKINMVDDHRANAIVQATRKVAPGVVGIVVTQIQVVHNPYAGDNFLDYFFGPNMRPPRYRKIENIGSGFIISEDGMILTNYHVVRNASRLYVNFPDGNRVEGRIVGTDESSDLAVVSAPVTAGSYRPVEFGNSDKCLIGEWSIALGNPFLNFINDAHPTVTVGVISALNRNFAPTEGVYYQGMIQTDASINQGNSGGPLVNADGEVIGINSFIYTGSAANTGSVGIGFAIPINRARRVAGELIAYGRRRQVWTGITVQNINRSVATALSYNSVEGVVIVGVKPQSPGETVGLKAGDIIHKMGGFPINSHADLDGFFLDYFVDDTIDIEIVRNGKHSAVRLALKEFPGRR